MDESLVDTVDYVHRLAETTLARLGDAASGLHVLDISTTDPPLPPRPGLQIGGQDLRISIGPGTGAVGPSTVGVHFSLAVPRDEATVATVEHIQDHVIEISHGTAVPPCPDHPHPLQPAVHDAVPSWVCPINRAHYTEPILVG